MQPYRIALIGAGTVGSAVLNLLSEHRAACEARAGRPLQVVGVAVRDRSKQRSIPSAARLMSAEEACTAEDVDVVVEVAGGVEAPHRWLRTALTHGKDVVTANKAVLAEHGNELFDLAREGQRQLLFEAAVAAAIPILNALTTGLPPAPIDRITGILNGTCNRILGELDAGIPFDTALADAQAQGFAEADPTLDISGTDAAHKLALLTRIVTGYEVPWQQIRCEGIEALTPIDLDFGRRYGWTLKLLAHMRALQSGEAALGVYPTWIAADSALGRVGNEFNGIQLEGSSFGSLLLQGKGAGGLPTAGSVVADITHAARGSVPIPESRGQLRVADPFDTRSCYYLRFMAPDRPGVLAQVASALGERGISIAGVEQPSVSPSEKTRNVVPIRIITHEVESAPLDEALQQLQTILEQEPIRIRIEAESPEEEAR